MSSVLGGQREGLRVVSQIIENNKIVKLVILGKACYDLNNRMEHLQLLSESFEQLRHPFHNRQKVQVFIDRSGLFPLSIILSPRNPNSLISSEWLSYLK